MDPAIKACPVLDTGSRNDESGKAFRIVIPRLDRGIQKESKVESKVGTDIWDHSVGGMFILSLLPCEQRRGVTISDFYIH